MNRSTRVIWIGTCLIWSLACCLEAQALDRQIDGFRSNVPIWRVDDPRWESIESGRDRLVLGGCFGLLLAAIGFYPGHAGKGYIAMLNTPPPLIAPRPEASRAVLPAPAFNSHDLLLAHNAARKAANLPPLTARGELMYAAQDQALWMDRTGIMAHDRPSGYSFSDRLTDYRIASGIGGENVAKGFLDLNGLMAAWMGSAGHKANILGSCRYVGFGISGDSVAVVFTG